MPLLRPGVIVQYKPRLNYSFLLLFVIYLSFTASDSDGSDYLEPEDQGVSAGKREYRICLLTLKSSSHDS